MLKKALDIFWIPLFVVVFIMPVIASASDRITAFQKEVWPNLERIAEEEQIHDKLMFGETVEDIMAFSYEIAVARLNIKGPKLQVSLGGWIKELEHEVRFVLGWMSFMPWWPKTSVSHEKTLLFIRLVLAKEAYNRLMFRLSLEKAFYDISTEEVRERIRKKSPVDVSKIINLDLLAKKVR